MDSFEGFEIVELNGDKLSKIDKLIWAKAEFVV
jgi:hypothetical protein